MFVFVFTSCSVSFIRKDDEKKPNSLKEEEVYADLMLVSSRVCNSESPPNPRIGFISKKTTQSLDIHPPSFFIFFLIVVLHFKVKSKTSIFHHYPQRNWEIGELSKIAFGFLKRFYWMLPSISRLLSEFSSTLSILLCRFLFSNLRDIPDKVASFCSFLIWLGRDFSCQLSPLAREEA